jgi:hypothetical protein
MKDYFGYFFTTASWWVCVLSGRYLEEDTQMLALAFFVLASLISHTLIYAKGSKAFAAFYGLFLLLGLTFDGLLLWRGHFTFTGTKLGLFPLWLLALWLVFPLNFLHTLKKFLDKPLVAMAFGLIGGPLAYKAGPAFEILYFDNKVLGAVSLFWGFYMLLACRLKRWLP